MLDRLVLHRFSTEGLPERDRHEAWSNRDWPSVSPIYATKPTEPFNGESERLVLNDLVIQYVTITAQHWERVRPRSWDPDHLAVVITTRGTAEGMLGKSSFRTTNGDVQLVDLAATSSHFSTASRTILLTVPRPVAAGCGLDPGERNGHVLQSGFAALLTSHLVSLREAAPDLPVSEAGVLRRGVLDLLSLAAGTGAASHEHVERGARIAAREFIERELQSSSLTPAKLCRALCISRSTLHRLFAGEGGVRAYIRRERLNAVRRRLADPDCLVPISLLAEQFGFSDAAHLSRLFRAEFDMTPSDCRSEARKHRPFYRAVSAHSRKR